jgi:hypothetical protein
MLIDNTSLSVITDIYDLLEQIKITDWDDSSGNIYNILA